MGKLSRQEKRKKLNQRNTERESKRGQGAGFKHLLNLTDYEDVKFFGLKEGKNYIDILPYEVSSKNHPDDIPIGEDDYKLEVWQHTNIGVDNTKILCLKKTYNKKCPICEAMKNLLDNGADWNDKEINELKPKIRCYYNIIDVGLEQPETEDIQIFEHSGAEEWFEDLLNKESKTGEDGIISFYDIEEGSTIVCRTKEDIYNKKTFFKPERIDFEDRDPYDEDIYDDVFPLDKLLKIPTYNEVAAIFLEIEDEQPPQRTELEGERPKRKKKEAPKEEKTSRRSRKKADEEVEQSPANACPNGYLFGVEFKKKDGCDECEDEYFDKCADEFDLVKEAEKENKPEKKSRRRK